jgi:hypothetical protein
MNKDLVIVESTSVNNESVPIIINVAEVRQGEVVDQREISRSFVFEDFQSTIPLKLAKMLIKQNPDEYRIVGSAEKNPSSDVQRAVSRAKEEAAGFVCEFCETEAKNKAGLTAHIRYNHPKEFAKIYQKASPKEEVVEENQK